MVSVRSTGPPLGFPKCRDCPYVKSGPPRAPKARRPGFLGDLEDSVASPAQIDRTVQLDPSVEHDRWPFRWTYDPDRGWRAIVRAVIREIECFVVLYPAVGEDGEVWRLGSTYPDDTTDTPD